MLNEVELLEELPYYRTLQKPPPQHLHHELHHPHYPTVPRSLRAMEQQHHDDTAIAIIAPDIRVPQSHHPHLGGLDHADQYTGPPCLDVLVSILVHASDLGGDLVCCYALFAERRVLWASLAASFVLLASALVNGLSLFWYVRNHRNSTHAHASKGAWAVRAVFHLLLMGMLYRYLHLLFKCVCRDPLEDREHRTAVEARKRKNAVLRAAVTDDEQTAVLCLLQAFVQSAPQLVLQLYALAQRTDQDNHVVVFIQGACAATSLVHLAWSITWYNSSLHRTSPGKKRQRSSGKVLQFLWHLCTIGSRACTLALFAREYHYWLFPFCIGHWGVMTVWVMHQQTRFCRGNGRGQEMHQCREYACNMAAGVAYVILYLNVKAEPTRYKYSAYYAVVFAENCALMTLWFLRNDPGTWYHVPALVAVFSSFASGIVFMLFYYGFCHRTLKQADEKRAASCC